MAVLGQGSSRSHKCSRQPGWHHSHVIEADEAECVPGEPGAGHADAIQRETNDEEANSHLNASHNEQRLAALQNEAPEKLRYCAQVRRVRQMAAGESKPPRSHGRGTHEDVGCEETEVSRQLQGKKVNGRSAGAKAAIFSVKAAMPHIIAACRMAATEPPVCRLG